MNAASTRNALACLLEAEGKLADAKAMRLSMGRDNSVCCACLSCKYPRLLSTPLKNCAKCHAVFYCSAACQKEDWKARHKQYCQAI